MAEGHIPPSPALSLQLRDLLNTAMQITISDFQPSNNHSWVVLLCRTVIHRKTGTYTAQVPISQSVAASLKAANINAMLPYGRRARLQEEESTSHLKINPQFSRQKHQELPFKEGWKITSSEVFSHIQIELENTLSVLSARTSDTLKANETFSSVETWTWGNIYKTQTSCSSTSSKYCLTFSKVCLMRWLHISQTADWPAVWPVRGFGGAAQRSCRAGSVE